MFLRVKENMRGKYMEDFVFFFFFFSSRFGAEEKVSPKFFKMIKEIFDIKESCSFDGDLK